MKRWSLAFVFLLVTAGLSRADERQIPSHRLKPSGFVSSMVSCSDLLDSSQSQLSAQSQDVLKLFWDYRSNPNRRITEPTVELVNAPSLGEDYVKLRPLPGKSWTSSYAQFGSGLDIQGDPRWIIGVSPRLAEFLGFSFDADGALIVPTLDQINSRLDHLSQRLEAHGLEPLKWRFYWQDNLSLSDFIHRMAQGELPLADPSKDGDHHFIHDISYHLGAVLLPDVYSESVIKRATQLDRLLSYLKTERSAISTDPTTDAILKQFAKSLRENNASQFDGSTGNTTIMALIYRVNQPEMFSSFSRGVLRALTNDSFVDEAETFLLQAVQQIAPNNLNRFDELREKLKLHQYQTDFSHSISEQDFQESFIKRLELLSNDEFYRTH